MHKAEPDCGHQRVLTTIDMKHANTGQPEGRTKKRTHAGTQEARGGAAPPRIEGMGGVRCSFAFLFVVACGGSTANTWFDVDSGGGADSAAVAPVDSTGNSSGGPTQGTPGGGTGAGASASSGGASSSSSGGTGNTSPSPAESNTGSVPNGTAQDGAVIWTCNACKSDLDCQNTCPVGAGTTYCCNVPFGTCYAVGGTCPPSSSTTTTNADSANGGSDGTDDGGSKKKKKDG
jgi:hypothetical protein